MNSTIQKIWVGLLFICGVTTYAQIATTDFVTTWDTSIIAGDSGIGSIRLIATSGFSYNYDVDWNNDGVFDDIGVSSTITHNYTVAGIHTVRIRGQFPKLDIIGTGFDSSNEAIKLREINQWGNIQWESFRYSLARTNGLNIIATDIPDLSNVTTFHRMFYEVNNVNGSMNDWDTSAITDMSEIFRGADNFHADMNNWVFHADATVYNMFAFANISVGAPSFTANINTWDLTNLKSMNYMFSFSYYFEADISDWDISNVITMAYLFAESKHFNANVSGWKFGSATTDVRFMFIKTNPSTIANPLGETPFRADLSTWDLSELTTMQQMFEDADNFGNTYDFGGSVGVVGAQDISNWGDPNSVGSSNFSSLISMLSLFSKANNFNAVMNNWKLGATITDVRLMFNETNPSDDPYTAYRLGQTPFNSDLSTWDLSELTTMYQMFFNADNFGNTYDFGANGGVRGVQDISNWGDPNTGASNFGSLTSMNSLFHRANNFNAIMNNWKLGASLTDVKFMFSETNPFDVPYTSHRLGRTPFNSDLSTWDLSELTTMYQMLYNADNFGNTYDFGANGGVRGAQDISNWGDPNSAGSSNFNSLIRIDRLFENANNFNAIMNNWKFTNTITHVEYMFNGTNTSDTAYTSHRLGRTPFNSDLSTWDLSELTTMRRMLSNADNFGNSYDFGAEGGVRGVQDISNWGDPNSAIGNSNFNSITRMDRLFEFSNNFNAIMNNWKFTNDIVNVEYMFNATNTSDTAYTSHRLGRTPFNSDLSTWDLSELTTMIRMLSNADNFGNTYDFGAEGGVRGAQDISNWGDPNAGNSNFNSVVRMDRLFESSNNFNAIMNNWKFTSEIVNVEYMFNATNPFDTAYTSHRLGRTPFNSDLSTWDLSELTTMIRMLSGADNFGNTYDFGAEGGVRGAQDISNWGDPNAGSSNFGSVVRMDRLFDASNNFNAVMNNWKFTDKITHVQYMFSATNPYHATAPLGRMPFNSDLSTWDLSELTTMVRMFSDADNFGNTYDFGVEGGVRGVQDVSNWGDPNSAIGDSNFDALKSMYELFSGANNFNAVMNNWKFTSTVVDVRLMFLRTNPSSVANPLGATPFNSDLSTWDLSELTRMNQMFHDADNFGNTYDFGANGGVRGVQDISNWGDPNSVGTSNFNAIISMYELFNRANNFNAIMNNWKLPSTLIDLRFMFFQTNPLGTTPFNSDLSTWDLSELTRMNQMFYDADNFGATHDFGGTIGIRGKGKEIGEWNIENVENLYETFKNCGTISENLYFGKWNIGSVVTSSFMFHNSQMSIKQYDDLLIGWDTKVIDGVTNLNNFHAGNSYYCAGRTARNNMTIDSYTWNFNDLGTPCNAIMPGGVSPENTLWLRSNGAVYTDVGATVASLNNEPVQQWYDESGVSYNGGNELFTESTNTPVFKNNDINFNPSINFTGTQVLRYNSPLNIFRDVDNQNFTYYVVAYSTSTGETTIFQQHGPAYNEGLQTTKTTVSNNEITFTNTLNQTPSILRGQEENGITNVYKNNAINGTTAIATAALPLAAGEFSIGNTYNNSNALEGNVAELIMYGAELPDTYHQRVESYLALKYGISLDQTTEYDYIASNGLVKIWDATGTATDGFNKNIFGIGRDDRSALKQKIGKSQTGSSLIISLDNNYTEANSNTAVRTSDFATDYSFLTVSDNGEAASLGTEDLCACPNTHKLNKEWKVYKSPSLSEVAYYAIHKNEITPAGVKVRDVYMLVSDDTEFKSGFQEHKMTLNGDYYELQIDLNNGQYFTFAVVDNLLKMRHGKYSLFNKLVREVNN